MLRFVGHLVDLFETFLYCRYNEQCQKLEIGVLLLDTFSTILASVYGIDEECRQYQGDKVFADAASRILDSF